MSVLDGVVYLLGFGLLLMPARSIPVLDGSVPSIRIGKHILGLILFAGATLRINRVIQEDAGVGFILASAFLILLVAVFKTWKNKMEEDSTDQSPSE